MSNNLTSKENSDHSHEEHPSFDQGSSVLINANTDGSGWYTIAEGVNRCFGHFFIYDITSSCHSFVDVSTCWTYGRNEIDVNFGISFGSPTITGVRMLRETNDPYYGNVKLQGFIEHWLQTTSLRIYVKAMLTRDIYGWEYWNLITPVLEGTPAGYEDAGYPASYPTNTRAVSSTLLVRGDAYATSHITTSDRRLKDNITRITDSVTKLMKLNGITYTRNDIEDKVRRFAGIIAQDLQQVLPEAVFEVDDMLNVDYGAVVPLVIEGVKELSDRMDGISQKFKDYKSSLSPAKGLAR